MKRKTPFEKLRHEIDLALLTMQAQVETAYLDSENEKINSEFYLGYILALKYIAARADDIYENTNRHTIELLDEKWRGT